MLTGRALHAVALAAAFAGAARLAAAQPAPVAPGQAAPVVPAQPAPVAPPGEGVVGQAVVAAGNVASARERALDDAFRQLVERGFTDLLAETGTVVPPPALTSLRATWIARPKRLVRNYRVLEQEETEGNLRVRVSAELDAAHMRREFDRARGSANRGVTPGVVPVVGNGPPEAAAALATVLQAEGVRAQPQAGAATDEAALRALAARSGRSVAVLVEGQAASEGLVRGTSEQSAECSLTVRLWGADGSAKSPERSSTSRAFAGSADGARAACYAKASRDLVPLLLPDLGLYAGGSGDLRAVLLDLDINEPAVITPVLRALRKIGGPTAAEVRRVVVGRVEVQVRSRLTAGNLVAALGRELASVATVTSTGQPVGDRVPAQVRLLAAAPPPGPLDPGSVQTPALGTQP